MKKFILMLAGILIAVFVCINLLTVLMASVTNVNLSAAQLVSNTTILTNQYITGLMIFISLGAGGALGYGLGLLRAKRQHQQLDSQQKWAPGPNAGWRRLEQSQTRKTSQLPQYTNASYIMVSEEEDELPMKNWGF